MFHMYLMDLSYLACSYHQLQSVEQILFSFCPDINMQSLIPVHQHLPVSRNILRHEKCAGCFQMISASIYQWTDID